MRGTVVPKVLIASALLIGAGVLSYSTWTEQRPSAEAASPSRIAASTDSLVVDLRVHTFKRGAGPVLVSSGIPLQSGALFATDLARARILVDGTEVPAYVAPLGTRRDSSLRSVLIQFQWTPGSSESTAASLVVGRSTAVARRANRAEQVGLPDAVALPARSEYLVESELVGPTISTSATRSQGGAFAKYESEFKRYADHHWKATADAWEQNYYDRSLLFYAAWIRTGDPEYWRRGTMMALNYRRKYLEPNAYGIQPHWAQVRGLELHYRLTGDTMSRRAVAGIFAHGLSAFSMKLWGPKADIENPQSEYMENRIQARVLQGALASYRMNASYTRPDGLAFRASEWPTRLRDVLSKILSTQQADGSYSWVQVCGGQLNYMVGMLNDVLIEYYRDFEPDPRIPIAVEKANEYLWTRQWIPGEQAFKYASVNCAKVGGMEAAGDLNGLLIASFGWLYQRTGDAKWRTRGDAILAGLVSQKWAGNYTGDKQFNQAFAESYRYLGWRQAPSGSSSK